MKIFWVPGRQTINGIGVNLLMPLSKPCALAGGNGMLLYGLVCPAGPAEPQKGLNVFICLWPPRRKGWLYVHIYMYIYRPIFSGPG